MRGTGTHVGEQFECIDLSTSRRDQAHQAEQWVVVEPVAGVGELRVCLLKPAGDQVVAATREL